MAPIGWSPFPSFAMRPAICWQVPANSMFVFIGAEPRTTWLEGIIERNERGFILTGPDLLRSGKRPKGWPLERDPSLLETNIPGIFRATFDTDRSNGWLRGLAKDLSPSSSCINI